MKKLAVSFVALISFAGMSFLTPSNVEVINLEDSLCRYRICKTNKSTGERTCGEWVYATCLDEVVITAEK